MPANEPTADPTAPCTDAASSRQEDCQWRAFQYLLGELPEDAAEDFELELADSALARECLVRATHLTEYLISAPGHSAPGHTTDNTRTVVSSTNTDVTTVALPERSEQTEVACTRINREPNGNPCGAAWWGIALGAACLILTAMLCTLPPSQEISRLSVAPGTATSGSPGDDSEHLAEIVDFWTRSLPSSPADALDSESEPLGFLDEPLSQSADTDSLMEPSPAAASSFVDVPGWMLAAVAAGPESGPDQTAPTTEWETN